MKAERTSSSTLEFDPLSSRCRRARDAAAARLMDRVASNGGWFTTIDLGGLVNASYIIMLRTSGLFCRDDLARVERSVLQLLKQQVNRDGGFFKFVNSPSSSSVTRLGLVAIRLALGDVDPGARPAKWFARNPYIDPSLETDLRSLLDRAEDFLRQQGTDQHHRKWEADVALLADLLVAQADATRKVTKAAWLQPWLVERFARSGLTSQGACRRLDVLSLRQFNYLLRKSLPAFSILRERSRHRCVAKRNSRLPKWSIRSYRNQIIAELADRIRADQNPDGSWLFNSLNTMLNVMALCAAGCPMNDDTIQRAHACLLKNVVPDERGGSFVNALYPDVWNTSHAVRSYLLIDRNCATDNEIRRSVAFLLKCQGPHGGFGWSGDSVKDAESDSTAFVLRTLALAAKTADAELATSLQRAMRAATHFLFEHQCADGGFGIWDGSRVRGRPGSPSLFEQLLFDIPAVDTTARITEGLAEAGLTPTHPAIKRALRFLLKTQCGSGAWWSRWWAGYLVGTAQVLRAFGRCGVSYGRSVNRADKLLVRSTQALHRGVRFVLWHQNDDGGWGETIRADTDTRYAGVGASTPLHTAFMLSALIACGYPATTLAVRRGMECLLDMMRTEGDWQYHDATFTLHAGSLYFAYGFLNLILPLDALTDYLSAREG